jgi:enamine deaminase RidA (YjgF/YER057c/UK114 family)
MSNLEYKYDASGPGQAWSDSCHYAQTVVIGDKVQASGQGGWDDKGVSDPSDLAGQVKLAIANVDRVLRDEGLRGWENVYCLRSYHVGPMQGTFDPLCAALKERIPNHRPIWTAIGVEKLAEPNMKIELEVEAVRE